jgi:TonB family protein
MQTPSNTDAGPDPDLLARHLDRLSKAPRVEVVIPRSLRLDTTARRPELLATVSTPSSGWKESLLTFLRSPGALRKTAGDSLTIYGDAGRWEVHTPPAHESSELLLDLGPELVSIRSVGLDPISSGCGPIADRLRSLFQSLPQVHVGSRVLARDPSGVREPKALRMDFESRALQNSKSRPDTVWYRADLSSRGKVESVFPRTPGLLDDATERRARSWTFLPAFLNGDPIAARINLGIPVMRNRQPTGVDKATWTTATTPTGAPPVLLATDSLLAERLRAGGAPWDTIRLRVLVGADGLARNVQVVQSVPGNDELAMTMARRSRYRPSVNHGDPIGAWVDFNVPVSRSRRRAWVPPPQSQSNRELDASKDNPPRGEFIYYEVRPAKLNGPPPSYPAAARTAGIRGTVVLHVLVGRDGRVKNVKVIRGVKGLDDAATEAVSHWVYKPALDNNRPVAVWIEESITFPPRE